MNRLLGTDKPVSKASWILSTKPDDATGQRLYKTNLEQCPYAQEETLKQENLKIKM